MTQEIADTYPSLSPEDFVELGQAKSNLPTGTATDPALIWYDGGDNVHMTSVGGRAMMSAMWDVIVSAATQPAAVSGTVTASATTALTTDTLTFTIPDLSADADRLVIWSDQAGNELGRGASLVTTLAASVTRVDARIVTARGADDVLTGPALAITVPNSAPVITSAMALAGGNPAEGNSFVINVTATDVDGDNLTYNITSDGSNIAKSDGPLASGVQASFTMTAGTAGVAETFSLIVSDGTLSDTATFAVTPDSANTSPAISGAISFTQTPTLVGDIANFNIIGVSDAETATGNLTYATFVSIDGGAFNPCNGATATGNVINSAGGVIATGHTTDTAGSHVFRVTVTDDGDPSASASVDSPAIVVAAIPSDPFGTSVYQFTWTPTSATSDFSTFYGTAEQFDDIGLTRDIRAAGINDSIRVRLYMDSVRNEPADWLVANPNAKIVFRWNNGTITYFDWSKGVNASGDNWPTSGIQDLWGLGGADNGWRNEDGTSRSDPNVDTSGLCTVDFYPGAASETMVFSGSAEYNNANAWANETELTGGTYWEDRTGDSTLDPFNNLVVTGSQIRWFTSQDGSGFISTAVAGDASNGTHEVRLVSPSGEIFTLSKTWTFNANNRVDWNTSTGTAVGSVQGSRTGSELVSEMRNSSAGDVWEFQYWEV